MKFLVVKKSGIWKTVAVAVLLAILLGTVGVTGAAAVYSGKTSR